MVSVEQLWVCKSFHCRELQNWLIAWDPQRAEVTSHYVPFKTCSLLTAQPDRVALCFLFLFFLTSLCLNYCGQAAFGHFSLSLSLSLCGCIMPKQKWHAGNDVMLYWCHSWHHSAWAWVSLLCHKRKTLLLNISSFACGDFFGWWLSQNCKAALSLWLFYAHTHAQMAMACVQSFESC